MSLEIEVYCNGTPISEKWLRLNEVDLKELVRDILLVGAIQIEQIAKTLVPVRTGRLRDSIKAVETDDGATVQATAPYAALVELGHVTRSGSFVPAVQFLTRAAVQVIPYIDREIEDRVNAYLRGADL